MELSRLRRRYAQVLQGIQVPVPFELDEFCARIERARGRPLLLHPLPIGVSTGFCGLYVEEPDADHVFFPAATSAGHQQHIVLHELTHLLCKHRGRGAGPLPESTLHELLPDLEPGLVRAALGRSRYTDPEEREAETVASLILQRASQRGESDDPLAAQIETTFG